MTLLGSLGGCRTVYFCGLAKNAGKTVALRQACAEARAGGRRLAVTSVGRDGEAFDAVYENFPKPRLPFGPGDVVVTSEGLLPEGSGRILRRFAMASPLGPIAAARVERPCEIEVAGPSTVAQLREARDFVYGLGADLFLVDGALDRKAATVPDACDGVVLSTGAALSPSVPDVAELTASAVEMLRLEGPGAPGAAALRFSPIFGEVERLAAAIRERGGPVVVDVEGAVTESFLDHLLHAGLFGRCHLVADSSSKIVVGRRRWAEYRRVGLDLRLRRAVKLLAVTVNPVSPTHDGFDPDALLEAVRGAVAGVPVFDVQSAAYPRGPAPAAARPVGADLPALGAS